MTTYTVRLLCDLPRSKGTSKNFIVNHCENKRGPAPGHELVPQAVWRPAMRTPLIACVMLLLTEVCAMADQVSFEADAIGAAPAGWTVAKTGEGVPKWTVEVDATAPSKSKVVKQSGRASYPLLFKDGSSVRDGFVEARFKPVSGSEDRAGGLVWRAKDANNYYVVRANALEGNVVLYKMVEGKRSALDIVGRKGGYGIKVPVPANQWHVLRVEFAGNRFKAIFNGKLLFEVEDTTFNGPGMVGLWTKADSITAFDDVSYGPAQR